MQPFEFRRVRPETLEARFFRDGRAYTELIRNVCMAYLTLAGCTSKEWSIDARSYTSDGGVDGLISAPALDDPIGLLHARSVLQFKSGDTKAASAAVEIMRAPMDGRKRIASFVAEGYQLVWFMAKTLTSIECEAFEATLDEAAKSISPSASPPTVIDANRLADYIARIPSIGLELDSVSGANTINSILANPPHSYLPFVAPGQFPELVKDLNSFILDPNRCMLSYRGEPGIGKTRRVLEALKADETLRASSLYFREQTQAVSFLNEARAQGLRALIIADDYIDTQDLQTRIRRDEIPNGCKVVIIKHAFKSRRDRLGSHDSYDLPVLTESELASVLAHYKKTSGLTDSSIAQAIALANRNIRLAIWICEHIGPTGAITEEHFEDILVQELANTGPGVNAIKYLALVRYLSADRLADFCDLIRADPTDFRKQCKEVSQRSGFIMCNDTIMYVSVPLIAQLAVVQFWSDDHEECLRIFSSLGAFAEDLWWRTVNMPLGQTKEELARFFTLQPGLPTLERLQTVSYGKRLLTLATALPERYLPVIHGIFMRERERLRDLPYEAEPGCIDRRDVIEVVRDLAQFSEFFLMSEEIVYAMALDEVPSAYTNVASSYWVDWFHPYFDFTNYPYDKRLDLLVRRVLDGDARDRQMAAQAIAHPFPQVGSFVPRDRVGGRITPPETREIASENIRIAIDRIPEIVLLLLRAGEEGVARSVGDGWVDSMHQWLSFTRRPELIARVLNAPGFPAECRDRAVVEVQQLIYVHQEQPGQTLQSKAIVEVYTDLLKRIEGYDSPESEARVVVRIGYRHRDNRDLLDRRERLVKNVLANEGLLEDLRPLLLDEKSFGAYEFGRLLGMRCRSSMFWRELGISRKAAVASQYAVALCDGYIKRHPASKARLSRLLDEAEHAAPLWSLAFRNLVGTEDYAMALARLLRARVLGAKMLGNAWVRLDFRASPGGKAIVLALDEQRTMGDEDAAGAIVEIAFGCSDRRPSDTAILDIFVNGFVAASPAMKWNADFSWVEAGKWLLGLYPERVIPVVIDQCFRCLYGAEDLVRLAAREYSKLFLDALVRRLDVDHLPWMANGALSEVLGATSAHEFENWIAVLDAQATLFVAGQLPRPYMGPDGNAIVPAHTRSFWRVHGPTTHGYEQLMRAFESNTFDTGVIVGYGVGLFGQRVLLAEQLSLDQDPAIVDWATRFLRTSKAMLASAERDEALDAAQSRTDI